VNILSDKDKLVNTSNIRLLLPIVSILINLNFSCSPFREEKKEEPETPRYRDRAKERREDQNPDYEPTELGSFHAVAPPGTDLR
jgi:IK cytokine